MSLLFDNDTSGARGPCHRCRWAPRRPPLASPPPPPAGPDEELRAKLATLPGWEDVGDLNDWHTIGRLIEALPGVSIERAPVRGVTGQALARHLLGMDPWLESP